MESPLWPPSMERIYGSSAYSGKGYSDELKNGDVWTYGNQGWEPLICVIDNLEAYPVRLPEDLTTTIC
jgi:hypothetical protein